VIVVIDAQLVQPCRDKIVSKFCEIKDEAVQRKAIRKMYTAIFYVQGAATRFHYGENFLEMVS